jgi:hypothetical protein
MTCLNKTYPFVSIAPAPMRRPAFVKTMMVFIEAFQEALDMRRAAQREYFFGGE